MDHLSMLINKDIVDVLLELHFKKTYHVRISCENISVNGPTRKPSYVCTDRSIEARVVTCVSTGGVTSTSSVGGAPSSICGVCASITIFGVTMYSFLPLPQKDETPLRMGNIYLYHNLNITLNRCRWSMNINWLILIIFRSSSSKSRSYTSDNAGCTELSLISQLPLV